ncbi:ribonuclease h2 subunit b [Moniliophthora roreri MCA 2997]|uniref:Ribonuclease H2 subunit B n=1 Tax=Moniliophthora roreri (strain MCA 2997) TaxID=1381753 RepID=V2XBK9_MONRO|nr:ribonuclease h2 subunit b [Moniliophthora roreri MCA 2997]
MPAHLGLLPANLLQTLSLSPAQQHSYTSGSLIRLPHPRTGLPALFLPFNSAAHASSISELQQVTPPNARSWFVGDEVVADGKLLFFVPVDPAFLLIHILKSTLPNDTPFRPADDILEESVTALENLTKSRSKDPSTHISASDLTCFTSLECSRLALGRICETKEISPELIVYRFSMSKAIEYLRKKVARLSSSDIVDASRTLARSLAKDGLMEDGNESLLELAHSKLAYDLVSQYLSPDIRSELLASYDFVQLDQHLKNLEDEKMCVEMPSSGGKKTKGPLPSENPANGKRKAAKGSQGVEKLKKANINGMAKLTTFFTKKP